MTRKSRFIIRLETLSNDGKKKAIDFFTKNPLYEKFIDWNRKQLDYADFEKVFLMAANSGKNLKQKAKKNPEILFKKCHCKIVCQTSEYIIAVPLDWKCAVFFNSFEFGGEGAKWCIGSADNYSHWNNYLIKESIFFMVYFISRHPDFGRKIMIECYWAKRNHRFVAWQSNDVPLDGISKIEPILKVIKKKVETFGQYDELLKEIKIFNFTEDICVLPAESFFQRIGEYVIKYGFTRVFYEKFIALAVKNYDNLNSDDRKRLIDIVEDLDKEWKKIAGALQQRNVP
jgi:hypothetical protein